VLGAGAESARENPPSVVAEIEPRPPSHSHRDVRGNTLLVEQHLDFGCR